MMISSLPASMGGRLNILHAYCAPTKAQCTSRRDTLPRGSAAACAQKHVYALASEARAWEPLLPAGRRPGSSAPAAAAQWFAPERSAQRRAGTRAARSCHVCGGHNDAMAIRQRTRTHNHGRPAACSTTTCANRLKHELLRWRIKTKRSAPRRTRGQCRRVAPSALRRKRG